jgi:peptidylprolyl isomerase
VQRGEAESRSTVPPKAATLPPTTPVITIHGYCDTPAAGSAASKSGCTTVITRAEFEKLVNTLQPNMPPQVRKQLATQYPQILYMAQHARKRGLETNPHYLQILKFTNMELLKLELERSIQDEADKVPDSEIADFYKKNPANFDQTSFLRVYVPKTRQSDAPKDGAAPPDADAVRKNSEADMKHVADELHARAVAGEDFDELQKDAYDAAGVKATPPPTLNANIRRGNGTVAQSAVFDLPPGQVSTVLNDPTGFYFFKVVSKTPLPLADVKDEIRTTLRTQRSQAKRQAMQDAVSADLNKDYFGDAPATPPGMPGAPHPMPSNGTRPAPNPPPAQPKE